VEESEEGIGKENLIVIPRPSILTSAPLQAVVGTWMDMRATTQRNAKRERLARLFASLDTADLLLASSYLSGDLGRDAVNVGWASVQEALQTSTPASSSALTLADLHQSLEKMGSATGPGSVGTRVAILRKLLASATPVEREFIGALMVGELRQGALRSLVLDALASVLKVESAVLRRAVMFGGFAQAVETARREGASRLHQFRVEPLVPVEPMLAATAHRGEEALAQLGGSAAAEWKLDGIRIQLHRRDGEVRIFTRTLRDVTDSTPELVRFALEIPARSIILDGEAMALSEEERPADFQDLMSRFQAVGEAALQLQPVFFDLLYLDGESWVDRPDRDRRAILEKLLPSGHVVPRRVVRTASEIQATLSEARAAGHEGLVLKSLEAPYAAGRRGSHWRKLKEAHTVDLVILAAEWGHGRRQGLLSNLHLGARDPANVGRFWMLGKTFKGLTDAMLRELTRDLPPIALEVSPHVVHVRPEKVVEIAFDGVQRSPRYDSGLALRFARVKRFRPDKTADEATTLEEVRQIAGVKTHVA
jgi:DNA ligase-1